MGTNLVPGVTPASVLAAALTTGSGPPVPAYFSTTNVPGLPQLMTEVVWLPTDAVFEGNWQILGNLSSLGWATGNVQAVTGAYTPLSTDAVILANATSGAFTVTLPDATQPGFFAGQRYTVKKTDTSGHAVTVTGSAGQLIDGGSSVVLSAADATTGVVFDGANWWVWNGVTTSTILVSGGVLTPTVQNANYTASPGDFVLVDTTSGAITVTLPAAPADKTVIGVKIYKQPGTSGVTVQRSGSDTFDDTAATTKPLSTLFQSATFQYDAALVTWVTMSGNLNLAQLDARYLLLSGGTMTGAIAMGSSKITGLANGSAASDAAAFGQIPVLDGTAADITPNGLQAAGATGKAADAGHVHQYESNLSMYTAPSVATAETFPRYMASAALSAMTSGTLYVTAIGLPKGLVVNNLTFATRGTAEAGGTHCWFVLLDSGLVVRAVTADQTGATFLSPTNSDFTVATNSYTTPAAGLYYVGLCVVATTMPAMSGAGTVTAGIAAASPILCGSSSTGQTTPPTTGTTMGALTANGGYTFYAYTS